MVTTMRKIAITDLKEGDLLMGSNGSWYKFEYLDFDENNGTGYIKLHTLDGQPLDESVGIIYFDNLNNEIMVGEE